MSALRLTRGFAHSLVTPRSRVINPILQRALRMRKRLCTASEPHSLADIVPPLFTPVACLAWQSNFQRDFVPNLEVFRI
jgi:hypothetical protein